SMADGMYLSVLCSEDIPFLPEAPASERDFLAREMADVRVYCDLWPHTPITPEMFAAQPIDAPALLLSGEADPVTPPENAEQAAESLPDSLSLVVPGTGHNVLYRGCLPRLIAEFIDSGSIEDLEAACVNQIQPPPFFLSPVDPQP
ncbi:MAG TPA: alpha/beta fold hydrolase, partial [Anaerolineaceae bacterium]|nr:alpha/beta fold hydrolase [Anaerolineaceae bacterium]